MVCIIDSISHQYLSYRVLERYLVSNLVRLKHGERRLTLLRTAHLEANGQTGTIIYKIAQLAEKLGGIYKLRDHRGTHPDAPKDVVENRAVLYMTRAVLPYLYLVDKERFARGKIHTPRENAGTLYIGLAFKKFSPMTELANTVIQSALDFGLVDRYMTEYLPSSQVASQQASSSTARLLEPLELHSLYAPYMFLLAGFVLACAVFAAEEIKSKRLVSRL